MYQKHNFLIKGFPLNIGVKTQPYEIFSHNYAFQAPDLKFLLLAFEKLCFF